MSSAESNLENEGPTIKVNDLVWAKLYNYPFWPSIVITPPDPDTAPEKPKSKTVKTYYWTYFFGSHDYAWIGDNKIFPYEENKEAYIAASSREDFKQAIKEIEDVCAKLNEDPNYQVSLFKYVGHTKATQQKKQTPSVKRARKSTAANTSGSSTSALKKSRYSLSTEPDTQHSSDTEMSDRGNNSQDDFTRDPTTIIDGCEVVNTENLTTSKRTFGFMGLGNMGLGVVKNLITSGHIINVWNRSKFKYEELLTFGGHLKICDSPRDLVQKSEIIFSCLTDGELIESIMQQYMGVDDPNDHLLKDKKYVELSNVGPNWSNNIKDMVESKKGVYLEVQMLGSKMEAQNGNLILLCAGSRNLYLECQSCFKAMATSSHFLGDVGYASKASLIVSLIKGVCLTTLVEGFALADRCGIKLDQFLEIFNITSLASPYSSSKAETIVNRKFSEVDQGLQHMQKDLKLATDLSDALKQPVNLAVTANEIFKHARRLGYDGHDASCIFMRTRH